MHLPTYKVADTHKFFYCLRKLVNPIRFICVWVWTIFQLLILPVHNCELFGRWRRLRSWEKDFYNRLSNKKTDMAFCYNSIESYRPSVNAEKIRENQFLIIINTYFKNHSKTRTLFQEFRPFTKQIRTNHEKKNLFFPFFFPSATWVVFLLFVHPRPQKWRRKKYGTTCKTLLYRMNLSEISFHLIVF